MSYPYTFDLFFGSEQSSSDSIAHISFIKPVVSGDKIRFISGLYKVSNDYTYIGDILHCNTIKYAYSVIEIDKSTYDFMDNSPEINEFSFEVIVNPYYTCYTDSSLENEEGGSDSHGKPLLQNNITYYYNSNEYIANSFVNVQSFKYDGSNAPRYTGYINLIYYFGGNCNGGFFEVPYDANFISSDSLVSKKSSLYSMSGGNSEPTKICDVFVKTYIDNVENKDGSYIPVFVSENDRISYIEGGVEIEGSDTLPSSKEELSVLEQNNRAYYITLESANDPITNQASLLWYGNIGGADFKVERDDVLGFVTMSSDTEKYNSKIKPDPWYDELTELYDFGNLVNFSNLSVFVILKESVVVPTEK